MTETANPRIQARLPEYLATWLTGRSELMGTGSHNQQAVMELGLWQTALEHELRRIRLTLPQARAIAAVCNDRTLAPTITASGPGQVFAACYDAFRIARERTHLPDMSSYAAQFGIDEQALLDYLGSLGPAADAALRDALARWWRDDHEDTVEGFARVGLRVTDVETPGEAR